MKTALEESAEFIFNECQIRLKQLSELNSPQDLVEKINELKELPKFAETLRILLSFGDLPMEEPPMYPIENQLINSKKIVEEEDINIERLQEDVESFTNAEISENPVEKDDISEVSEINFLETVRESVSQDEPEISSEVSLLNAEAFSTEEVDTEKFLENYWKKYSTAEPTGEMSAEEEAKKLSDLQQEEMLIEATIDENLYEKNVRIREEEILQEEMFLSENAKQEIPETPVQQTGNKIKLANIKAFSKNQPSLFDEHTEDNFLSLTSENQTHTKTKPDFKLDLNDRIAFTKNLFNNSQTDLNDTIKTLNSFETLEEAQEYLSEVYYDRNWKKVDEYAQRLWSLVENKFL